MPSMANEYTAVASYADEIIRTFLDLEGGELVVATFIELIQSLLNAENTDGAVLAVKTMVGIVDIVIPDTILSHCDEAGMFIRMLIGTMQDILSED